MEDLELLEIYMWGFNDELDGRPSENLPDKLKQRAYGLGRDDAIIGDDLNFDDQTDIEILQRIKNYNH